MDMRNIRTQMVQYYITVLNWGEILLHYSAWNSSERQRQHILAYLIAMRRLPFCIFGEGFLALWTDLHQFSFSPKWNQLKAAVKFQAVYGFWAHTHKHANVLT